MAQRFALFIDDPAGKQALSGRARRSARLTVVGEKPCRAGWLQSAA
jgi:hypothetical protein